MTKVREHDVLQALAKKHKDKDAFFTHVKNGRTQAAQSGELAIIDAIAIAKSWSRPVIRGYEVKVERSDFLRDTKWHKYFDMCHEFSFACPTGLIQPEEIPEQAGLIYFNPDKQSLNTKKKAVYRNIEMPVDMLWYIIICQLESDRMPFFSSTRDYFEAWVSDKEDKRALGGWRVGEKLRRISEKIPELERQLDRERKNTDMHRETLERANQILKPFGITLGTWGMGLRELQRALQSGGAPNLDSAVRLARQLEQELSRINESINRVDMEVYKE